MLVLIGTISASSMAFIDGTVVNVAFPAIQREFAASVSELQWLIGAYGLFVAAFVLSAGAFADRFGRALVFVIGVTVFAISSAWCGLATTVEAMIVARGLQGIGAALLIPTSLAILSGMFAEPRRARAIGIWTASTAAATAIGPLVGALMIETISWRGIFFINIPMAIVAIHLISRHAPPHSAIVKPQGVDIAGAILIIVGLGAIVFGLINGTNKAFNHSSVWIPLGVGAGVLVLFGIVERCSSWPMVPFHLFWNSSFCGVNVATVLLYAALALLFFFHPYTMIYAQGYSETEATASMLPFILAMTLFSSWAGGLTGRYGARRLLIVGSLTTAGGYLLLSVPGIGGSYWATYFPGMAMQGFGMAICIPPLTTTVMSSVEDSAAGLASGINNAMARLAALLAVALIGVVIVSQFSAELDYRLPEAMLPGEIRQLLIGQAPKLAELEIPPDLSGALRTEIEQAIKLALLDSYRAVMWISAGLAFSASLVVVVTVRSCDRTKGLQHSLWCQ
jgi:EmrB/QacA subfamily drug resistance transporter